MNKTKQKNIFITSLLAIVLIMAVGYAAFATNLTVNGTASISSNWCIGFDSTKTTDYVASKTHSTGDTPTGSISFSGNACQTNYKTNASLVANFKQPGDKIVYTLTIANKGSLSAAIKSILVDNNNVTSNQTITKGNVKYTIEMPLDTSLAVNETTTMQITAEFQNDTNISTSSTSSETISVQINATQDDGSGGFTPTPATFTGTIYRNNTNLLLNGLTMNGDAIVWYPTTKEGYSSAQDAFDNYYAYSSQASCEADAGSGNCISGTATITSGSYETQASNLNKTYYLKHTVVNDIITASYVCFVTDTEHCMQGGGYDSSTGTSPYYSTNRSLLESQETWFNNHSGGCDFRVTNLGCGGGGFGGVGADSHGYVSAYVSNDDWCGVIRNGSSHCRVSSGGGGGS